jgi:hypothetical protein
MPGMFHSICQAQNLTVFESPPILLKSAPLREAAFRVKVFYVEWRTKDQSNVKVYDQKRTVEYADYKVGLFYISPFELFVEGEPVSTKLEKRNSRSRSE